MDTMSFRFGFDDYLYFNKSVLQKNDEFKEIVPAEKYHFKKYNEGEKNR